ncbi:hypothetical protein FQR65_LT14237 [Abscondita terminalis]|nr:hypothetical protein FQR65_LT14237 [Abscondita terminalis]
MDEFSCRTCCLSKIKQEVKFDDLISTSKLVFPDEDAVNITENPVACDKAEIDESVHRRFVKEEIKTEDLIKSEGIVDDHSVLFNTDIPRCIEKSIPVNILYCYECNYGTNDKRNLTDHIFAHRNRCSYTTPDNSMLMTHITETLQCGICNYTCIEINLFDEHMYTHNVQKYDLSKLEDYKTNDKMNLKFINEIKISKCEKCNYSTSMARYLRQHMVRRHGQRKLRQKFKLMDYADTRTGKKVFNCNLCNYRDVDSNIFKIHLLKHSGERPISCDKCDYKTYNKKCFNNHKKIHSKEKPFKCSLCDFGTKHSYLLTSHSKKHSGELNLKCDKCDYKTYSKVNLRKHVKVHSKEKPFKCSSCDFSALHLYHLKFHSKKHSGERNLKCDQCDYKTYFKSYLNDHKKAHCEEKPFKCHLCDFSTKKSYNLKVHSKKHSVEFNFVCDKCDYKTVSKKYFKKHVKVHSKKLFKCGLSK